MAQHQGVAQGCKLMVIISPCVGGTGSFNFTLNYKPFFHQINRQYEQYQRSNYNPDQIKDHKPARACKRKGAGNADNVRKR